jgi:hypothetical protein
LHERIALLGARFARVYHPCMSNNPKDNRVRSPIVVVRVTPPMLRPIDQFAQDRCLGRAEAVRALLHNGFEASLPLVANGDQQTEDAPQSDSEAA